MRILYAFNENSNANTFTFELTNAIRAHNGQSVDEGLANFWECKAHYDIVHIHWPEALFKAKKPTNEDLHHLSDVLHYWKSHHSKIVVTRHNILPHYKVSSQYEKLYDLVYENADAVVHLGEYSKQEYQERYLTFHHIHHQHQAVIPHGLYTQYPNIVTRPEARKKLNISEDRFVILVFGKIRNNEEMAFLKNMLNNLPLKNKLLLVPRWKFSSGRIRKHLENFYYFLHPHFKLNSMLVKNEDVQLYMNAADIMILPRFHNLNSGSLVLGFSFGKVVVGPDYGVVGEILTTTNNPVFNPEDINSVIKAISQGKTLDERGKGQDNMEYAQQHWSWELIAHKHVQLYRHLLNNV